MESKSISNDGFVLWMDKTIGQIGILNGDCGSVVKNLPARQETRVQSLSWEDPLEKRKATHSSIPAWRIPWTEEPGCLQSMGSQRVRYD